MKFTNFSELDEYIVNKKDTRFYIVIKEDNYHIRFHKRDDEKRCFKISYQNNGQYKSSEFNTKKEAKKSLYKYLLRLGFKDKKDEKILKNMNLSLDNEKEQLIIDIKEENYLTFFKIFQFKKENAIMEKAKNFFGNKDFNFGILKNTLLKNIDDIDNISNNYYQNENFAIIEFGNYTYGEEEERKYFAFFKKENGNFEYLFYFDKEDIKIIKDGIIRIGRYAFENNQFENHFNLPTYILDNGGFFDNSKSTKKIKNTNIYIFPIINEGREKYLIYDKKTHQTEKTVISIDIRKGDIGNYILSFSSNPGKDSFSIQHFNNITITEQELQNLPKTIKNIILGTKK